MVLRVFNTMNGLIENFRPFKDKYVKIYVCGPTVYDWAHLGHARTYIAFDVIIRWLEYKGYSVFYIQNITDVGHLTINTAEDKIGKRAKETSCKPMQLVEFYMREYFKDLDLLGVKRPDISPRATGHLIEIIEAIHTLIKKGFAYEVNGNVFFDVSKLKDYGKLSKIRPESMLDGTRFDVHIDKRNPKDFAIWKKAKKGTLLKWWSPWSVGFPGWHIECTIMGLKYFGSQFDIHGGARDLIFPHHENEIAQSEAITGKTPFVKYWLHTGFLKINGEKMAKSLGNYITIRDALKKYKSEAIRLFVLSTHYRNEIDFTDKKLREAENNLNRLYNSLEILEKIIAKSTNQDMSEDEKNLSIIIDKLKNKFIKAMDEDFNTPAATAILFEFSKEINKFVNEHKYINRKLSKKIYDIYSELGKVLGLFQLEKTKDVEEKLVNNLVQLLFDVREELRKQGNYEMSDKIRTRMKESGLLIEDTTEGPKWKLK